MVILNELQDNRYDVFLSFRGADTRLSFTDHLYNALKNAGLATFYDDEEIRTGEKLKPELESAIKASRASIIVLSKNYAFSRWCLDELVLILEQHRNFNQIVIPIFYHVEPTHVRNQQGSFGEAMADHEQRMDSETDADKRSQWARNIELWKKTLKQVADLKGHNAHGWLETKFIEEIVTDIYHRIGLPNLPLLIGMKDSIKFVSSWLKDRSSQTGDVLTILGIGGVGKTSLAKYMYTLHSREFKDRSFIPDISTRWGNFDQMLDVQKQLFREIIKTSLIHVHDVSKYTSMIENALARKKVLLVLDDIDSLDQLDMLLGNKGFHPGSKIIITTKDSSMTKWRPLMTMQVQPTHTTHLLKGLSETESWELLYLNAFRCEDTKEGYEEVSDNIVKYCEGHPLALKLLGRSLYNQDVAYWKEYIKELKREPKFNINKVLQMSFDTLPSRNDKELFLHIACFFDGMDKDISETILSACDGINTKTGIPNLIDRCLLRIEWNQLKMHSLIQEMGRDVVRQESPAHPEKRTRLWCHEDSFKVLKRKKGTDIIKGLVLDMKMLDEGKLRGSNELKIDAMNNMDNLIILHLNYVKINQFYENFPEELRWLCMKGFPLKAFPSDLVMFYLVVLDMSYSNIESFGVSDSNLEPPVKKQKLIGSCSKSKPLLGSLKILDLSFCKQLRSLGGFCELPTLERLIVKNCTSLIEVCESVEQCGELVLVDFSYCIEWRKFAKTIDKLKKVKTLLLDGCNLSEFSCKVRDMDSQKMPKAKSIEINSQTSNIVEAIPRDLKSLVISLPGSLVSLSLGYNNLSNESFPMDFSSLSMLKELILDGNPIVSMPNCVRTLPRLDLLGMADCKMLMSIDQPPPTLTVLSYSPDNRYRHNNQSVLRKIVFDPEMLPLKLLTIFNVLPLSSTEIEGLVKIQPMEGVEETLLHSLGWSNLEFIKKRRVVVYHCKSGPHGSQTQIYYEFGIFSTFYGGEEMPKWIEDGPSISFTIPSSPSNRRLRGLNLCYVEKIAIQDSNSGFRDETSEDQLFELPVIKISNISKNRTWIYRHYITDKVKVGGAWLTFISHWIFGMDDMEAGDQLIITAKHYEYEGASLGHYKQMTIETKCGVSFIYNDRGDKEEEEEEDPLGYYKSWNHIIGGDLSHFQLTTGEYILDKDRFTGFNFPFNPFIDTAAVYKEMRAQFKAISKREVQRN